MARTYKQMRTRAFIEVAEVARAIGEYLNGPYNLGMGRHGNKRHYEADMKIKNRRSARCKQKELDRAASNLT